jgi:hypothetical protein
MTSTSYRYPGPAASNPPATRSHRDPRRAARAFVRGAKGKGSFLHSGLFDRD